MVLTILSCKRLQEIFLLFRSLLLHQN
ncbi:hypothetical protein LINGRAHAP2_LOCUS22315 [Linum grandiflorum]